MLIKQIRNLIFISLLFLFACSSKKESVKTYGSAIARYADLMDVSKKKLKNARLYRFINKWEGTKYQYGGLDQKGIDCSGLVYLLYKEVYEKEIPRMTSQQLTIIKRKYENQLKEGDLVFFDYDGKKFSHVGVFLQNGYYVHASTKKGVMISRLKDPYTYKYFSRGGSVNIN